MNRINLLKQNTFNKIAAGEVVDRPFSVVKELLENSIDANSKNIIIEIEQGGEKSIKITDDGVGIHGDDVKKAFLPHATSKINNIEDLFVLTTMGFRGEALSSIASVSKTLLKSKTCKSNFGTEIYIEGGDVLHITDTACNNGTIVEVRDLFFNVPARLKFLKSPSRESALISDIVHRLALGNSDISFKLINNGKVVLNTFGNDKLDDTIRTIYGKKIGENLISFETYNDIVSVYGYIGNSEISRGSRNNQSIFVNKRYVKNKSITVAVENAFKSFLTINKFPFFVLYIDIFPEYIDVNVHPSKTEIKFKDNKLIFGTVFNAVHEAIKNSLINSFNIEKDIPKIEDTPVKKVQLPIDLKSDSYIKPQLSITNTPSHMKNDPIILKETDFNKLNTDNKLTDNKSKEIYKQNNITNKINQHQNPKFSMLKIIGQFNDTYILGEYLKELYIIDQHAAHEKILFEKYTKNIQNQQVVSQILMTPAILELFPEDFLCYIENKDVFKNAGFIIEIFGDNTISIREVPFLMGKSEINGLFLDIINNIKNMGSGKTFEVKYKTIATLACKSAVKAHDKLSLKEMETLVEDLRYIDDPFTCPHGRPTIIKFTLKDLEKKFKRIQ